MKRLIAITILLTACHKEPLDTQQLKPQHTINFATELINTKGVTKKTFTTGDQFFVHGINTNDKDYNIEAPNGGGYVFDEPAAKGVTVMNYGKDSDDKEVWNYSSPVVWSPGKSTFFAFSPVPTKAQSFGISLPGDGFKLNTIPSINFTVAGGYDPATASQEQIVASRAYNRQHVDLLTSYTPNQTSGRATALLFGHALAQITFGVKPMQDKGFIRINSVTLKNVMTSATLNLAHGGDPTALDFTGGWVQSSLASPRAFSINLRHDVASIIPATPEVIYAINDDDETLMMIPQSVKDVVLSINYSYSEDGIVWPNYPVGKLINVDLSKISLYWGPGKQYRYVLAISPNSNGSYHL